MERDIHNLSAQCVAEKSLCLFKLKLTVSVDLSVSRATQTIFNRDTSISMSQKCRPCCTSVYLSSSSKRGGLSSIPGQAIQNLWWEKWH